MLKPIVVVGSANIDLVCTAKRIPVPGETITGNLFRIFHGGKGANQAVAAARLGYPVRMVAKVGDDEFGQRLRKGLESECVDVEYVTTAKVSSSGVALISTDHYGHNTIVVIPGANGRLLPVDLQKALPALRSAGLILTQLETPLRTVRFLAHVAERFNIPLMLDPAPARRLPSSLVKLVTYLSPNETEACILSGIPAHALNRAEIVRIAQRLTNGGARNVIVKMGERGVCVAEEGGRTTFLKAFKVCAVDSTAAGDAFNAGLAVALMQGKRLSDAGQFAAAVAALSVTRMGAQPSMPRAPEVNRFLKKHGFGV